ncbi:spore germination protein [Bacillus taeanensis]|uniref:Spore germination protein n=1 Tax=Bacillus taeanensis TaxID=273032 RepID=A0A366XSG6_9BACI|nr:spore germination protein [Bacillus taeanensis]
MSMIWKRLQKNFKKKQNVQYTEELDLPQSSQQLDQNLQTNIRNMKDTLGNSSDLIIREFKIGQNPVYNAALICMDGLIDADFINDFLMKTLMNKLENSEKSDAKSPQDLLIKIKEKVLTVAEVKNAQGWNKLLLSLLSGETVLLIDGCDDTLVCSTKGGELRSILEPVSELSIRGPRDSFTESIRTNTAMVRRRIKSPNLWVETMQIGEITQTDVGMMYVKGIVNDKLVQEVKERLERIEIDEVLASNTIEEYIIDATVSPWPTIFVTERPDVVAGNLMEGRIVIFVDGTPFPLLVPATWNQFFQSAEDYYLRWNIASFIRFIRVVSLLLAMLGPSIYIAFLSFHQELIPSPLLVSLAAQRQGIPFPVFIEALLMEFTFEILREAGVRMPRPVGSAVSIVGALVLGDAAVQAGIVSAGMVIVVSATAIGSFTIPHHSMVDAVRIIRFALMALAASFGIYGIGLGVIMLVAHTCSLRSFGIPYLAPFAPLILSDQGDTILRLPKPWLAKRPRLVDQNKIGRSNNTPKPKPPEKGSNTIKKDHSKRNADET